VINVGARARCFIMLLVPGAVLGGDAQQCRAASQRCGAARLGPLAPAMAAPASPAPLRGGGRDRGAGGRTCASRGSKRPRGRGTRSSARPASSTSTRCSKLRQHRSCRSTCTSCRLRHATALRPGRVPSPAASPCPAARTAVRRRAEPERTRAVDGPGRGQTGPSAGAPGAPVACCVRRAASSD
jgi:hypothetical protein